MIVVEVGSVLGPLQTFKIGDWCLVMTYFFVCIKYDRSLWHWYITSNLRDNYCRYEFEPLWPQRPIARPNKWLAACLKGGLAAAFGEHGVRSGGFAINFATTATTITSCRRIGQAVGFGFGGQFFGGGFPLLRVVVLDLTMLVGGSEGRIQRREEKKVNGQLHPGNERDAQTLTVPK